MYPKYYRYPAFFYFDEDGVSIEFPDLPGCLPCAESEADAFSNAKEALGIHLYGMEKDGDAIPAPSPVSSLHPEEGGALVMVEAFMPPIREHQNNKAVKKTLTIPSWLNAEAEAAHINFSQFLQDALIKYLKPTV